MKCENLEQVRENIDRIDREIVKLIAERSTYVAQAAKFKNMTDDVKAPQRVEKIIEKVRNLAKEDDANPDIVENIYREMINSFINFELAEHKKLK
jgi:isochorismate pyruvate lyase